MNMTNKVVIVTGAGAGIGRCIAKEYAANGAHVIIAEKNEGNGRIVEKEIISNEGKAFFIKVDISNPPEIETLMKKVNDTYGEIHILINNAAVMNTANPLEISVDDWDQVINTNLRGTFLCIREAVKYMKSGGAIVNIASTRAIMSEPNSEAYAASKGGIISITHAFAASLSRHKIQVNSISPGWIKTEDYSGLRPIDHIQHLSGRVGRQEDVARACLFLTDQKNNFINGANIVLDGGMTKKMIYEE